MMTVKKSTGSAFVVHSMTLENSFQIEGELEATNLPQEVVHVTSRFFVKKCGTYIYYKYEKTPGRIIIKTSTFDEPQNFLP